MCDCALSCKGPYYNTSQVHCVSRTQRGLVFAQGFVSNLTLTMSRGDLLINSIMLCNNTILKR